MVGGSILGDEIIVADHAVVDVGLLNCPLANVRPFLFRALCVLLGVGGFPSGFPAVAKLLKEFAFDGGRLHGEESISKATVFAHARGS